MKGKFRRYARLVALAPVLALAVLGVGSAAGGRLPTALITWDASAHANVTHVADGGGGQNCPNLITWDGSCT